MKKVACTVIDTIAFIIVYEILAIVVGYLVGLLFVGLSYVPILGSLILNSTIAETIVYTFMPITIGMCCIAIMGLINKKLPFNLYTVIAIGVFMSYIVISHLVNTIATYGLISWDVVNAIWLDVILCVIIFGGLLGLAGLKEKKDGVIN